YHLYLQRSIGMELSYDQFCEGWNDIMIAPFESTISVLEQVKSRLPVYALSNSNHLHKGHWESSFPDQMAHFDRVFVSSDLGLRKPDPAIYTRVLEELDIHPMNVLFFDDLEANIEAARALGLQTVLVKSPNDIVEALQERSLLR
ncbi:MAG: epoxide hydrolase-like predicted phosphatase, partial [Gammaproteobacteria bacterium]